MSRTVVQVQTIIDNKSTPVTCTSTTTAEDVCISICKQLGIGTAARHLFALRDMTTLYYLMPAHLFDGSSSSIYELRVRFKMANVFDLQKIDLRAYDYYFHQVRNDVLNSKIPELLEDKFKKELIGLSIADMYRVMLEKDIPSDIIKNDYRKYIPKEVLKKHSVFIKKPIHKALGEMSRCSYDSWFIKQQYLKQLEYLVKEYPVVEEYKALMDQGGSVLNILVKVTHSEQKIKYCLDSKRDEMHEICSFDDLGFISLREDCTVEICRKNGIPFYLMLQSLPAMYSFVSLLDGYYRLTCKWTFNICKDVPTPSLQKLYAMKCHGPVGGEFSYAKLEVKCNNTPGCFILRECESKYNILYIDVCVKDSLKPKTYKIDKINGDFIFNDDVTRYTNVAQLKASYSDPEGAIYLAECVPPSEYDESPLLLCRPSKLSGDALSDGLENIAIAGNPICINTKELQIYKGHRKEGSEGFTFVYRSMWRHTKGKKIETAMKILKSENKDKFLKQFLELSGQWAFLQSSFLVRLFGVTLTSQLSMVMEYFRLGPLDQYLRENKATIKEVDLIQAAANLASALWHLSESHVVHGNIRCRKLLVSCHDENVFSVKLADPGIHVAYPSKEVHWIPIECYSNLDYARKSTAADVWAFATTLWEIFMYSEPIKNIDHVNAMRYYASGKRLPQPRQCPTDIYKLMLECWERDVHRRKRPQAITRDINQLLYQVYNSRRAHPYSKIKSFNRKSKESVYSNSTECTNVANTEDLISVMDMNEAGEGSSQTSLWSINTYMKDYPSDYNSEVGFSSDFSNILSNFDFSTATTSLDSINSIQSIFELDDDYNVILQGRIGQGFYGEVYKGTLEYIGDEDVEPRLVAVKKLKASALSSCLQDFEREISIMKALKHPNIVEILGVLRESEISLVMEFVQHGSLQNYLKINKESMSVKQLLNYALDIAKGMDYLGKKNIVHRDMAARNILVVDENHVKISDFGLAQVVGTNNYYILKTDRELPIKWYALESLREGKFSTKSDVWSYGVTMYEMFSFGEEPNLPLDKDKVEGQEQQILLDALESGKRFACPLNCPQTIYARVIYDCWLAAADKRPTFRELCLQIEDLLTHY